MNSACGGNSGLTLPEISEYSESALRRTWERSHAGSREEGSSGKHTRRDRRIERGFAVHGFSGYQQ